MADTSPRKENLKKDVVWNLIGQFTYLFGLWLITVMTTKFIGFEGQGILSLALVASNICMAFGNYYLRVQYAADIEKRFQDNDYVITRFILTTVSVLICFIYCLALNYSWAVIGSIMLYYVYKAFELLSDIYQGVMQRSGKLYIGGITMTAKGVLSVGVFALLASLTHDLNWGLFGIAIVAILIFVLNVILTKQKVNFSVSFKAFSYKTIGRLVILCFPLFLLLLLSNILPSLPRIFFEKIYDSEQLGKYASIANIAVLIQTAASAIMMPLIPRISRLYKEKRTKEFLRFVGIIIIGFSVLAGLACILAHFLGDWALRLVYGEEIGPYTYTFVLAIVATSFTALLTIVTQVLGGMERRFYATIAISIGTGICAAISYPLCVNAYMNGISWALIISEGIIVALSIVFILVFRKPKPEIALEETL